MEYLPNPNRFQIFNRKVVEAVATFFSIPMVASACRILMSIVTAVIVLVILYGWFLGPSEPNLP